MVSVGYEMSGSRLTGSRVNDTAPKMATATTSMPTATGRRTESVTRLMADPGRERDGCTCGGPAKAGLRPGLLDADASTVFQAALPGDDDRLVPGEAGRHFYPAVIRVAPRHLAAPRAVPA